MCWFDSFGPTFFKYYKLIKDKIYWISSVGSANISNQTYATGVNAMVQAYQSGHNNYPQQFLRKYKFKMNKMIDLSLDAFNFNYGDTPTGIR